MRRLLLALLVLVPAPAFAQSETIEYYGQDAIGSIRIVFAPDGTVLGRQDYAPFGRQLLSAPALPKEGFIGNVKDYEIEQGFFHARQYEEGPGRFNRVDPVAIAAGIEPQQLNRYAYARNNPLRYTDPTGLREKEAPEKPCDPKFVYCGKSNPPPIGVEFDPAR